MEFIPEHTPSETSLFTDGYLNAAEWLLDDEQDRDAIAGWSAEAIEEATKACEKFQAENSADLELYYELSGRDDGSAGHDLWLSSNGHGAGFFDRGDDPVFDRLQEAARKYSERDAYLGDDGFLYFM